MADPRIINLLVAAERLGLPLDTATQFRHRKILEATAKDFQQIGASLLLAGLDAADAEEEKRGGQRRGANDTDRRLDDQPIRDEAIGGYRNDNAR